METPKDTPFHPQPVEEKESEKTNLNINMENQEQGLKMVYTIKFLSNDKIITGLYSVIFDNVDKAILAAETTTGLDRKYICSIFAK